MYLPVTDLPWDQLRLFLGTEIGYWNYLLNTEKKVGRPSKKMDGLICRKLVPVGSIAVDKSLVAGIEVCLQNKLPII